MLNEARKPTADHVNAILNAEGSDYVMKFQRADNGDFAQNVFDGLDGTAALDAIELKVKLPDGTVASTGVAEAFLYRAVDNLRINRRRAAASSITIVENIDRPLDGAARSIVSASMLREQTKDAIFSAMTEISTSLMPAEDVNVDAGSAVATDLGTHLVNFQQRSAARIAPQTQDAPENGGVIDTPFQLNVCDAVDMFLPHSLSVARNVQSDIPAMGELWKKLMDAAFGATPDACRAMPGASVNDELIDDLVSICDRVPTPPEIQRIFDDLMPNYVPECVLYEHENFKMLLTTDDATTAAYFAPTPAFCVRLEQQGQAAPLQIEPPLPALPAPTGYKEQLEELGFVEAVSSGWTKFHRGTEFLVGAYPNALTQADPGPVKLKSIGRAPDGAGEVSFTSVDEAIEFIATNRPMLAMESPSA